MIIGMLLIAIGVVLYLNGSLMFELKVTLLGVLLTLAGTVILLVSPWLVLP